jgi:hypothetical protein
MNEPKGTTLNTPEPPPVRIDGIAVWDLVIADMRERDQIGRAKYGTPLQVNNGRRPLFDLYQELLDAAVYTRQEIEKRRDVKARVIAFVQERVDLFRSDAQVARDRGDDLSAYNWSAKAAVLEELVRDIGKGACDALE